jgi:hypothetical protein
VTLTFAKATPSLGTVSSPLSGPLGAGNILIGDAEPCQRRRALCVMAGSQ